jgi:hypothetical protein
MSAEEQAPAGALLLQHQVGFAMAKLMVLSIVETIAWFLLLLMAAGVATLLVTQAELRLDPPRWSPSDSTARPAPPKPSEKVGQAAATDSAPVSLITWRWAVAH